MPKLTAADKSVLTPKGVSKKLSDPPEIPRRTHPNDVVVMAVDPGAEHTGVVVGHRKMYDIRGLQEFQTPTATYDVRGLPVWAEETPGWEVTDFAEMKPDDFAEWIYPRLSMVDVLTVEKFTLYASLAKEQIGSEMLTSQLIGFLRHIVRIWNATPADQRGGEREIQWFSYPAAIQEGTASVMKRKSLPFTTPATPDHARSAELHFWHTLIRNGLVEGVNIA
jgi:hypothetical protein